MSHWVVLWRPLAGHAPKSCQSIRVSLSDLAVDKWHRPLWAWQPVRDNHCGNNLEDMKAAREREQFRKKQADQLNKIRSMIGDMMGEKYNFHNQQIERHKEGIRRHTELMKTDKKEKLHEIHIKCHQEAIYSHSKILKQLLEKKNDMA